MARFIGALDQGTTSTRFMVFDAAGAVVASCQREHRQVFPQPGWVEHDPLEIAERAREVIAGALSSAKIGPEELTAIGFTNQRETTVVWERRTGRPVHNAIVWQDMRTDRAARQLEPKRDWLCSRTGLPPSTYFSALKLQWILKHVEGVRAAAHRGDILFGTIDSWLIWNLTGGVDGGRHVTDVTNAGRTQLMNLDTLDWDEELLKLFDIPREMLPQINPSSSASAYGVMRVGRAEVPIGAALGDQHAATVGQVCFASGAAKNTYGTGNFMLLNTGERRVASASGLLTTLAYQFEGEAAMYALEGSVAVTGAAVQWLRDRLGIIRSAAEIEALAASVPDSGGIYFVPAFAGLFAPYWRSDARGVIVGLSGFHTKAHVARAALEAICFQTRAVAEAMQADSNVNLEFLKVDGGASVNNLLMQTQADILGATVVRPRVNETTALGAAYAAGLATGFWKDTQELSSHWQADREWRPCWSVDQREAAYRGWEKAVQRSLEWVEPVHSQDP